MGLLADDGSTQNDVWTTITKLGTSYFDSRARRDEARSRTTAAPTGVTYANSGNPAPGSQGAYPQAENKPAPGGAGFSFSLKNFPGVIVIAGIVLLIFALARR